MLPVANIEDQIKQNGYATVNVDNAYYYTCGFGLVGKPDVIALPIMPFGMFQVAVNKFYKGEAEVDKPFFLEEFKVSTKLMGEEPSRCKFESLEFDTIQHIMSGLMTTARKQKSKGVVMLLTPDKHNFIPNEKLSVIQFDIDEAIVKLAKAVHADLDTKINEAQKLLKMMGVKV